MTQFMPNPYSRTSRMLAAARELVDNAPGRRMSFLDIYNALPPELIPQTKNGREIIRKQLREDGHRVGLVYVNAGVITLKESPHLASAG